MSFSVLPPEINSALMFSGAGSGPMLAAAAAWDGLSAELESAANSFSSVTSALAAQAWQGPASQAMVAAAAPYAGWLSTAAAHASGAAAQAETMVFAFESALAATVPPEVVAANRSGLVSLVISNLFGLNAPAIAETESRYQEMWAQDVAAMLGYHSEAVAAAAQLASPAQALQNAAEDTGYGNIGTGNIGDFNFGTNNFGFFNAGTGNVGYFNFGNYNIGVENVGSNNVGIQNIGGAGNFGAWNFYGNSNAGFINVGTDNIGILNAGTGNIGYGVTGDYRIGIGRASISYRIDLLLAR